MVKERPIYSAFDILGPVMVGPSSSHTAGACRMGLMAGQFCGYQPKKIDIQFAGTLAKTHSQHKTDIAVVAGALGIPIDDTRLYDAFHIASQRGVELSITPVDVLNVHRGTAFITTVDENGRAFRIQCATIGGGNITVDDLNGYQVHMDGKHDGVLLKADEARFEEISAIAEKEITSLGLMVGETIFGENCLAVLTDCPIEDDLKQILEERLARYEPLVIKKIMPGGKKGVRFFSSVREWEKEADERGEPLYEPVIRFEMEYSGRTRAEVVRQMAYHYKVMQEALTAGRSDAPPKMSFGILEGGGKKMRAFAEQGKSLLDPALTELTGNILGVQEYTTVGRIVPCPTGVCGGLISSVIMVAQKNRIPEAQIVLSLFVGAAVGIVCAETGTISGSVGGCQAEVGVSSAITAAALVHAMGGSTRQIFSAAGFAITNLLGLVCDPLGGLIEIPCIQRTALSGINALQCAEMALAGIDGYVPLDEVIDALRKTGEDMPQCFKGSLCGGISVTKTGKQIEALLKTKQPAAPKP